MIFHLILRKKIKNFNSIIKRKFKQDDKENNSSNNNRKIIILPYVKNITDSKKLKTDKSNTIRI